MLAGSQPKPQCKLALLEKTLHGRTSRLSNVRVHFTLLPVEISVGRTIGPAGRSVKFSNTPDYWREALIIRKKKARKSIISVVDHLLKGSHGSCQAQAHESLELHRVGFPPSHASGQANSRHGGHRRANSLVRWARWTLGPGGDDVGWWLSAQSTWSTGRAAAERGKKKKNPKIRSQSRLLHPTSQSDCPRPKFPVTRSREWPPIQEEIANTAYTTQGRITTSQPCEIRAVRSCMSDARGHTGFDRKDQQKT